MRDRAHFERYVDRLSNEEALILHRVACRRAAFIYGPIHKQVQERNYRMAMANLSPESRRKMEEMQQVTKDAAARRRAAA